MMPSRSKVIQLKRTLEDLFKSPHKSSSEDLQNNLDLLCMK